MENELNENNKADTIEMPMEIQEDEIVHLQTMWQVVSIISMHGVSITPLVLVPIRFFEPVDPNSQSDLPSSPLEIEHQLNMIFLPSLFQKQILTMKILHKKRSANQKKERSPNPKPTQPFSFSPFKKYLHFFPIIK